MSIKDRGEHQPIPDWHRDILDKRAVDFEKRKIKGEPWETVKERILQGLEKEWLEEIDRRIHAYESGASTPIPAEEVFREFLD